MRGACFSDDDDTQVDPALGDAQIEVRQQASQVLAGLLRSAPPATLQATLSLSLSSSFSLYHTHIEVRLTTCRRRPRRCRQHPPPSLKLFPGVIS